MNAVVFDLDDTLLRDDLTISDFSVRVFQALHKKGFHIIAASGRSEYSMKPYIEIDSDTTRLELEKWNGMGLKNSIAELINKFDEEKLKKVYEYSKTLV